METGLKREVFGKQKTFEFFMYSKGTKVQPQLCLRMHYLTQDDKTRCNEYISTKNQSPPYASARFSINQESLPMSYVDKRVFLWICKSVENMVSKG